ncbi:GAL3ST1 [Branchiostoma lanceolatum]|uniref:GAL3ST1 protein n=1 Tax=Branchiostoma lanceolatum TaxID=7740 RepID=A0A8J9YRG4_BRALA|nr:GAL3ST1 [Branchiostoma lanceolatum]
MAKATELTFRTRNVFHLSSGISLICRWRPFEDRPVESVSARDDAPRKTCRKKTNFVFIKVHKAGGTAMCQLFFRFGLRHRLNFVLPNGSSDTTWFNLGWPNPLKEGQYMRRINDEPFNILTNHAVYSRDVFQRIMPNDTAYLAILREPFSHLKSAMNYYNLPGKYRLPRKDAITAFLRRPSFYEGPYRSRRRQRFSHTNLMAHDMGIKFSARLDTEYVERYVTRLDREFLLVLILEYLDESLVLLKRYMCWDMEDILYKKIYSGNYDLKSVIATPELRQKHEKWSKADYILYRHFNRSLWTKINREGQDFWAEVRTFRDMHARTTRFCRTGEGRENQTARLVFDQTPWTQRVHIDFEFCRLLRSGYAPMRHQAHVIRKSRLQGLRSTGI